MADMTLASAKQKRTARPVRKDASMARASCVIHTPPFTHVPYLRVHERVAQVLATYILEYIRIMDSRQTQ